MGLSSNSINVLEDAAGLAELRRIGARSVPVLSRGDDWVFAQNLGHVVKFLGLNEKTGPALTPDQLAAKTDLILRAAIRLIPQMPDAHLTTEVPNRPRSYKVLAHHIFRIQEVFLEAANGATLTYEALAGRPTETMQTFADIAAFGEQVRSRSMPRGGPPNRISPARTRCRPITVRRSCMRRWSARPGTAASMSGNGSCCSGCRGITPDRPLTPEDFAGLPMPTNAWDG